MKNNICSITDTCKPNNEDIYGATNNSCWIMDGALPLNRSNFTDESNDVVWMVNWWQNYLKNHMDQFDKSIVTILEEGVAQINHEFSRFANINELGKLDRASAGIAVVRINNGNVESFVLGDVEINIKTDKGIVTLVDGKVEALDKKVMDMIFDNPNREMEFSFNGYTKEELRVLRENRSKMNSEDGYYILEHDVSAIKNGIYEEYQLDNVKEILMMSDGFSSIHNKYKLLSVEDLLAKSKNEGIESILKTIRDIEKSDPGIETYKRLQRHDDATAVYIRMDQIAAAG
ncbi:MAG TPA: protein phosphatase 2C domain-containing protein [Clostridia bacterium]|nr:protein phosphatase 2C domain-containing protein [Clostridia bacterium]